jgi:ABC-type glycerol-3-phosphate transport system permease component
MKQFWSGLALFLEVSLLAALLTIIVNRQLPTNPAILIWAAGLLAVLSWATTIGAPWPVARRITLHGALVSGAVLFLIPFAWLIGTTLKYNSNIFIFPPRWLPSLPRVVDRSPYVVAAPHIRRPSGVSATHWRKLAPELRDILWTGARPYLPPHSLNLVQRTAARRAVGMLLLRHFIAATPRSLWRTDAQALGAARRFNSKNAAREVWKRILREVVIRHITVKALDQKDYRIPLDTIHWHVRGPAKLLHSPKNTVVAYHFRHRRSFSIIADFPRPPQVKKLLGVDVSLREDRSWHYLHVILDENSQRYVNANAFYLGAKEVQDLSFKIHHLSPSNQCSLGIWPLVRRPKSGSQYNRPGWIRLKLKVVQTSQLAAAFHKFTRSYVDTWYADPNWLNYLYNTLFLAVMNVILTILGCSMVAYAFARLHWPGRDTCFAILLGTMMLPGAVTMIPVFLIFKDLGWYNTLLPLWVPAIFGGGFNVFMLRQFMKGVPRELEEAALIDGCGWFGIYWRIVLPLMKMALVAIAIFTFMGSWNDFMGPLIYLNNDKLYTLPMGLYTFQTKHNSQFGLLMAASTMMILPIIVIFFFSQRYFLEGITLTGVKG